MDKLVEMVFGSHLYGTNTPQSDRDYKGIYVPDRRGALLGRIENIVSFKRAKAEGEKNTSDDVDREFFSIHKFIKLACEGQTVAIDMLHADSSKWIAASDMWMRLVAMRERFYSKGMDAFIGYAMRQAAKYGVKGSRLACAKLWLVELERAKSSTVMGEIVDEVRGRSSGEEPIWEHAKAYPDPNNHSVCLEVVGKRFTTTTKARYYIESLRQYVQEFGARARQAETNEGIDWKAMSHAIRAAYEVRCILDPSKYGELRLPFDEETAFVLRSVKQGLIPFKLVQQKLESMIDEAKEAAAKSTLPESINPRDFDYFILDCYGEG